MTKSDITAALREYARLTSELERLNRFSLDAWCKCSNYREGTDDHELWLNEWRRRANARDQAKQALQAFEKKWDINGTAAKSARD